MKAVIIHATEDADVLQLEEVDTPARLGSSRVRTDGPGAGRAEA